MKNLDKYIDNELIEHENVECELWKLRTRNLFVDDTERYICDIDCVECFKNSVRWLTEDYIEVNEGGTKND